MKKALKITGKILLGILILLIALLLIAFVYNRIMLSKEESLLEPLGQMVEVDGNNTSVYTEGQGEHTIVIMSGSGMPSPIDTAISAVRLPYQQVDTNRRSII